MAFNSLSYLLFLPATFLLFYKVRERYRWLVLLLASLAFYSALQVVYLVPVLLAVASATFALGLWLGRSSEERQRRRLLWLGVGGNVLVLVLMKYWAFLIPAVAPADGKVQPLVIIGVSYYIFQAISYLVDIYLEIGEVERHYGHFLLFMAFFPKILQGPIERGRDLLPQLKEPYRFDYATARSALLLFAWGLFKKVVVADRLGLCVNTVYGNVHAYSGLPLLLATYFYALQIYFDFSGYTDMALGTARLFNLRLTQNFNSPYQATSVADFWRRWHISFSRWILDYIFKPLQMQWRDLRNTGIALALLVTFFVSGLWHGAAWGFAVWGLLHGCYLAASVYYKPLQKKIHKALGLEKTRLLKIWQIFVTFHLVCLAWIFFRARTLADAWYVVGHLFAGIGEQLRLLGQKATVAQLVYLNHGSHNFIVMLAGAFLGFVLPSLGKRIDLERRPVYYRWAVYYLFVGCLIYFGLYEDQNRFIYFQF